MNRYTVPFSIVIALASGIAVAQLPSQAPKASAALEAAPSDTVRLRPTTGARHLVRDLETWLGANPTSRAHIATDRPLYRPGDTVQARIWSVATRGLSPAQGTLTVELLDPRGLVVTRETVDIVGGGGDTNFALDKTAPGGAWTLRTTLTTGEVVERPIVVNTFEAPRIKKNLEFGRKGYGPGDRVEAAVTLERATGEKLANTDVVANVLVAGQVLAPIQARTNSEGEVLVAFVLPSALADPDVLLTVLVDDAGVTESISRAVPITLDTVALGVYPEGGELVGGLESRVYIEATDPHGAPVDVEGVLLDDHDQTITNVRTARDGRGRLTFTPSAGRVYRIRTDKGEFPLPEARAEGCVMRHFDDLEGSQTAIRVRVACTRAQDVTVLATQQEQILDRASFHVDGPTTVHLRSGVSALDRAQGVARITLFNREQAPLAERLVFRNKSRSLRVSVTTDRARYGPGDGVALRVRTSDADGRPVSAQVAVSVVDDTVLALADDAGESLASRLLLAADLPAPIEGAADWLRPGAEEGGLAVDLALGTRGWRRFDWQAIEGSYAAKLEEERRAEEQEYAEGIGYLEALGYAGDAIGRGRGAAVRPMAGAPVVKSAPAPVAMRFASVPALDVPAQSAPAEPAKPDVSETREYAPALPTRLRTDFRDTVLWKPSLTTGSDGTASVRFSLPDSITSFRATAEGLGAGLIGAGDAMVVSTLPFHVEARVPVALSTGDHLDLAVTLENQRSTSVDVDLVARVGSLFNLGTTPGTQALSTGERRTVWLPLDVRPGQGLVELTLDAAGGGVRDALVRTIPVVPRGVPQAWSASGRLEGQTEHTVVIPPAALEGSISGTLTLLPTPISEVLTGIEQMVRTPGGCFEQTSSTNWPNVVVLDLLEQSGGTGRLAVDRKQVLDTGYGILKNYQVGNGGFETWGSGPGKEALTAYGLLEFTDMARVYDVSPKLLAESAKYLLDQRTGTGGYRVSGASAHGYGTAPPEVLDAYITYALVETGQRDIPREIDQTALLARKSTDPYRLSLATLTLLKARPPDGKSAAMRLAALQAPNGSFPGSETSITRSENYNLDVEATALAAMALLRAGEVPRASKAVEWLRSNQTSAGQWGATQGNALALRAIGDMAAASTRGDRPGQLAVRVDGELVSQKTIDAGGREPIPVDLGKFFSVGTHTVSVTLDGLSVPYVLEAKWTTELPASDAERRLDLVTRLADPSVALGHTTRMTTIVTNRTDAVVPDPIARIGLPAGLEAQTKQLEALKKSGEIAFFELRPREVTVYWDGIGVGETHTVSLDLVATNAGRFTAPASAAYPYYDDQAKAWVAGTVVQVVR